MFKLFNFAYNSKQQKWGRFDLGPIWLEPIWFGADLTRADLTLGRFGLGPIWPASLSLTQFYRYTPEIFLFSTATFKYKYRAPLRRIEQEYSAKVAFSIFQSLKRIQSLPVRSKLI